MPGNRQAFSTAMNAADRYRWDSQWAEAAKEYQRALVEFPDDAMARGGLGFCYMQTKQWQKALDEYEYTLKRDHSNIIALSKTAELYGILNRRDDAYLAYLHLADLYSQAGQGARAEAAWQKAVQLSPGDPEPHERLAAYYYGKKDIAFMIQERLAAAQGYLQRNDVTAARAQCEEVLRADASNKQAKQLLSSMNGHKQQHSGPHSAAAGAAFSSVTGTMAGAPSGSLAFSGSPMAETAATGTFSGGNTGNMGNMGSAANFNGVGNPGPSYTNAGIAGGMESSPRRRITASQVTGVLKQAQTFQTQGRFNDAIDLCEQILESGFDRPDARYFLGWLYQEQQRWDEAISQFQLLLNDPDYALSCYYAYGQCYLARGDLRTATVHFDEAVDRVNLDALTVEESDQLVQLCQEAAEAHRALGEMEQASTVYNALLGFLRSRGWKDKVAQVEFMLQQMQNAPGPARPVTPPPQQQVNTTQVLSPEQMARPQPTMQQPPMQDAATMVFNNMGSVPSPASAQLPASPQRGANQVGDLPDWLTGILSDADKSQVKSGAPSASSASSASSQLSEVVDQPTTVQPVAPGPATGKDAAVETRAMDPLAPATTSWLTDARDQENQLDSRPEVPLSPLETSQGRIPVPTEPIDQMVPPMQSPDIPATP